MGAALLTEGTELWRAEDVRRLWEQGGELRPRLANRQRGYLEARGR